MPRVCCSCSLWRICLVLGWLWLRSSSLVLAEKEASLTNNPAPTYPGAVDLSFDPGTGADAEVSAATIQSDGKILVAGSFQSVDGFPRRGIARLHSDGRVDQSFNPGTGFGLPQTLRPPSLLSEPHGLFTLLAELPDARIMVGGFFTNYNGVARPGSVRLHPDGSLDSSYNPPADVHGAVLVQPDGKVLTSLPGARLNPDGTLDTSFNTPPEFISWRPPIALRGLTGGTVARNGDLLVAGEAHKYDRFFAETYSFLLRLKPDGTKDPDFKAAKAYDQVAELADGRILTGTYLLSPYFGNGGLARLSSDGKACSGLGVTNSVTAFAADTNDKILVATSPLYPPPTPTYVPASLFRLNPNASLDTRFSVTIVHASDQYDAYRPLPTIEAIAIQPDGNIIIAGLFTNLNGVARGRIARLIGGEPLGSPQILLSPVNRTAMEGQTVPLSVQATGNPEPSYQWLLDDRPILNATNATLQLASVRLADAGAYSVLVSNRFETLRSGAAVLTVIAATPPVILSEPQSRTVHEGANVSLSVTAHHALPLTYQWQFKGIDLLSATNAVLTLNNVRLTNAGAYAVRVSTELGAVTSAPALLEIIPAGAVDPRFDPGWGPQTPGSNLLPSGITRIALQADGKIAVAGNFLGFAGRPRNRIARLSPDGSLDQTFDPGGGVSGGPYIPGAFGSPLTAIHALAMQRNGKILIAGGFEMVSGVRYPCLARLNPNGGVDTSFRFMGVAGGPPSSRVYNTATIWSMAIQPDGKILIGGSFTIVNGAVRNNLARLEADGTLDPTLDPGDTVRPPSGSDMGVGVDQIGVESDGDIWIRGRLSEMIIKTELVRLKSNGALDSTLPSLSLLRDYDVRAFVPVDGKLVVALSRWGLLNPPTQMVRLKPDAALDPRFNNQLSADGPINLVAVQAEGQIVIAGGFTNVAGVRRIGLARLHSDGRLDLSFDPGLGPDNGTGTIHDIAPQANGSILVAGAFRTFDGADRADIALLEGDDPAAMRLRPQLSDSGQLSLSVRTLPGKSYQLEGTASLTPPNWRTLQEFTGDGTRQRFIQPRSSSTGFFRVR